MATIALVLLILVSLVVVHELGHFIAAKIFGIKVDEFGIGYPPRAFSFGRWGETEYTLNWLPFGGFVRLWGEEETKKPKQDPRGFMQAAWYKQIIVLVAGVAMNVLAAWVLFVFALHVGIPREIPDTASKTERARAQLIVTDVVPASPAAVANIKAGDVILTVSDGRGHSLSGPSVGELITYVHDHLGKQLTIVYVHGTATTTADVTPVNGIIPSAPAQPALGIGLRLVTTQPVPFSDAYGIALDNTWNAFETIGSELFDLIRQAVVFKADLSGLVGPVGLVGVVHDAAQNGFGTIFALAAFISVNLAIINSIPIPALDGGRIVIVLIETIIRRRLPILITHVVTLIGIGAILLLMAFVTYHDILRLFA